ncbi:NAD(P)H-hydrate dehydratase [Winogradskyella aurantiaca]|uniref:NAD(P)H-hydrate dehydratase n=1 Tax=Winogradskyella aurantiaca TaxID=2219558 RepID=UPI000E1E204D|nr:NAD(P)H-hydrate dehydratase [Winogradskyella aurantiaca]
MKLLSKEQVYEGDRLTTERQGILSSDLMERAGIQIFNWIHDRMQGAQVPIHIFCGIGNNGGDGLVIARHLITHGYEVNTYIVNYSEKRSKDFLVNYDRIKGVTKEWPIVLNEEFTKPEIAPQDIIIDAVFGIGINRPPADWVLDLFRHLESTKAFTLSVDIPSGLYTDRALEDASHAIRANYTLSFQTPKLVFFLKDTYSYTVQWEVLDIGIDRQYLGNVETKDELIGKNEVVVKYQPRDKYAHKGDYGHALMIGGSYGKMGAITLASRASLQAGAGLVTSYIPQCGYNILQNSLPEAMVETDPHTNRITEIKSSINFDVVGIGMGMGTHAETVGALRTFLEQNKAPMVMDADAVNMLSKNQSMIDLVPKNSILTPHRGELRRLIGEWSDDFEMLERVTQFSNKYSLIVVIKGAHTITVFEDKRYINTTGNPGMATAGSGDVLSGVITGLMGQNYSAIDAAIMGVYLHGKSGDLAVEKTGYQSLIAGDLIYHLGASFLSLFEQDVPPPPEEES